jgi:hypothetical protein
MNHIDYFYEPIPTIDGHQYYIWLQDEVWKVIDGGEVILRTKTSALARDFMQEIGCDMEQFNLMLQGTIAVEAVTHIQALKLCEELVGRAAIEEAMKGVEAFGQQVVKAVKKVTGPKLEVVK